MMKIIKCCNQQMNIQEKSLKPFSSESAEIRLILKEISDNSLAQAQKVLDQSIVSQLQQKYEQIQNSQQKLAQFLSAFIALLIHNLDALKPRQKSIVQSNTRQIMTQEYEILQEAVQKSQAQVRKHIRIEHQFKIYLDGLQEEIQQLKKQTSILQLKNQHLTQTIRQMQKEKKHLIQKLQKIQEQKLKPSNSHDLSALSRAYKDVFVSWKYTGNKSKKIMDKIHDRTKLSNKRSTSKKMDIDKSSQAILAASINKKITHPRNLSNNKKDSLKQLVKTVQMKDSRVQKRKEHPINKYSTELCQERQHKIYRSNSVCN